MRRLISEGPAALKQNQLEPNTLCQKQTHNLTTKRDSTTQDSRTHFHATPVEFHLRMTETAAARVTLECCTVWQGKLLVPISREVLHNLPVWNTLQAVKIARKGLVSGSWTY